MNPYRCKHCKRWITKEEHFTGNVGGGIPHMPDCVVKKLHNKITMFNLMIQDVNIQTDIYDNIIIPQSGTKGPYHVFADFPTTIDGSFFIESVNSYAN